MAVTVHLEVDMPDGDLGPFLRTVRAWEGGRQDVRLAVKVTAAGLTQRDVQDIFNSMDPPLPYIISTSRG